MAVVVASDEALEKLRAATNLKLRRLIIDAAATNPPSWVQGGGAIPTAASCGNDLLRRQQQHQRRTSSFFDYAGFLHLPSFVDADTTCRAMKEQMIDLVQKEWHPDKEPLDSFGTDAPQNMARGDYFLESADRVHFFAEPGALSNHGGNNKLKAEYYQNKLSALNKAGHALHLLPNSVFRDYTMSDKLRDTVLSLGWKDPVVPQSMYIFKQAVTGGAVNSHQDSTFLYTGPRQTCLGLWLALDDATLENGCLWVRPCSHHDEGGTRRQYQRNVEHFGTTAIAARRNDLASIVDASQPMFVMKELITDHSTIPWDGGLPGDGSPEALFDAGFLPIECKAGDLLAFSGELDHLSLPNTSQSQRHTFQLHLVEGPSQGVVWSEFNWLQYPAHKSFLRLLGD